MSNLIELIRFNDLAEQGRPVFKTLLNREKYLAHTPRETVDEHLDLVIRYFLEITKVNKAEKIIDNLLLKALLTDDAEVLNYAKRLFFNAIAFHDHGKANDNFQIERMSNTDSYFHKKEGKLGFQHSILSAYIFVVKHFDEIQIKFSDHRNQQLLSNLVILFSYPIIKHHSPCLKFIFEDLNFADYAEECKTYLEKYQIQPNPIFETKVFDNITDLMKGVKFTNEFAVFSLVKLNYSLMTAADYYATHHFKSELKVMYKDWGILNEDSISIEKLKDNFKTKKSYNQSLFEKTEEYRKIPLDSLNKKISSENLNLLRQKLGVEVLDGIEEHINKNIFYIEAPTGGGKTNLSVVALIKLLDLIPDEITKIFYVFPFTTLITQTAKSLAETLGLTEKEMIQLHSKAGFHSKEEEQNDGVYGNRKANYIDNLFVNYPFVLLSHIRFFDLLKTNRKEANYVLHRLVNSVVIIDELQSYSPAEWDKVKYFISQYAESFSVRFILMSATLPKIHSIAVGSDVEFQSLIKDAQRNYLQNINFSQRVQFDFSLLKKYKSISYEQLEEVIFEESGKYASKNSNSVYTIVEFIFKKSATEFFNHIQENNKFNAYKIFLLSGTILEPRRRYIINFLKDPKNRKKKILLITTQVVEAGVDIDMDLGFKNQSLLDSDEQLAGRINRNVNKPRCKLFLFKKDESFRIYGDDYRYSFTKDLSLKQKEEILSKKDFKKLYDLVNQKINNQNLKQFTDGFNEYKELINKYHFEKINSEFRLIDSKTESFFVPLEIPIFWSDYPSEPNFSKSEQFFLKGNNCVSKNNKIVIGANVWNIYVQTIRNKKLGFIQKSINIKTLQGVMSKFVFSSYNNSNFISSFEPFCEYDEELASHRIFGFYCIDKRYISRNQNSIYSLIGGLNDSRLECSFEIF